MAKGKKSSGKHYTSKGERDSVARKWVKIGQKQYTGSVAELNNKIKAHNKLKNVMLTIPNPNTNETNKRFIKVNSKEYWGSPKRASQ